MLKQPSDSDRIRNLFEQNTIRKPGQGNSEPVKLSLPEPIEGASPALKPLRRSPSDRGPGLLPFIAPEDREHQPEAPASSHSVARLNRIYELSSRRAEQIQNEELAAQAAMLPPDLSKRSEEPVKEVSRPKAVSESPELQSRLRKTQLRLKTVQILLRVSVPLSERLKEIAGLMSESFSLWQVQLHLPVAHRPEQLEVLGSYARKGSAVPKPGPEIGRQLQKTFKDGRESTYKQTESQHLLLPLVHRSERLGVLEGVFSPAHSLSADEQLTLKSLTEEIAFYLTEERAQDSARALSDHDSLTGLLNHRAFQQRLEEILKSPKQLPASLVLLDLDFFRQINEVHGYQQGDQVLQQIARMLGRHLGEDALLSRFGGEEYALLLPETSLDTALELAGGLRQAIACEKISGKFNSSLGVTASFGVAALNAPIPKARQTLLEQAFNALAVAKEKGRNQVQAYEKPRPAARPETTTAPIAEKKAEQKSEPAKFQLPEAARSEARSATKPAQPSQPVVARKWSDILIEKQDALSKEWERQTNDYGVAEVSEAVTQLAARLPRLMESLCSLLDGKQRIEELEQMPLSYYLPSPVVAAVRRGQTQLISYEVGFMLLQESLQAVLGKQGSTLQDGIDHFFLCINEKLTALKTELQKGR